MKENMQGMLAQRAKETDQIMLGRLRFRIGVLAAQEQAFSVVKDEIELVSPAERTTFEGGLERERHDMLDNRGPSNILTPVADYMVKSAIIERSGRDIKRELRKSKMAARPMEKAMTVVDAKPGGKGIPKAFVIDPPRVSADPYAILPAVHERLHDRMEEETASVKGSSGAVQEKLSGIQPVVAKLIAHFRSKHPEYAVSLVHAYNNADRRFEFRFSIQDAKTGQKLAERTLGDEVLAPNYTVEQATNRLGSWLGQELRNRERENIDDLVREYSEGREIRDESILLSGRGGESLKEVMRSAVQNYYEDKVAERRGTLATALKGSAKNMSDRQYLEEVGKIEQTDVRGMGIPEEEQVRAVCDEIIAMGERIPPRCQISYDFKKHEIVLTDISGSLRRLRRGRLPPQRIPVGGYESGRLQEMAKKYD